MNDKATIECLQRENEALRKTLLLWLDEAESLSGVVEATKTILGLNAD